MPGSSPTLTNDGPIPAPLTSISQAIQRQSAISNATALQTSQVVLDQYQNASLIIGNLNQMVTIGAGWISATAMLDKTSTTLTSVSSTIGITAGMVVYGAHIALGTTVVSVPTSTTLVLSASPTCNEDSETISVGAGAGVEVQTGLSGSFGLAYPSAFVATSFTVLDLATPPTLQTIIVASAAGLSEGMQLGSGVVIDPVSDEDVQVIQAGTNIANIAGTTITLSLPFARAVGTDIDLAELDDQIGVGLLLCACTWTEVGVSVAL